MSSSRPVRALALVLALGGARLASAASPPEPEADDDEPREIVVASPPGPTLSSRTITAAEINAAPIRTAEDALRLTPGLVLVQHGAEGKGQQYFLRGFDAVHGLDFEIELDGIPLNEWSNIHAQGYLDLGLLIPELISAVEVVPGPFALGQGPFALAGSARYRIGVPAVDRGLRAAFGFGSTLRERMLVSYSPREGDGSRLVAVELMNDRGWGVARDSRRVVAMARQHLFDRPHGAGRLSAMVIAQASEFGLPGLIRASEIEAGRIDLYGAHDPGRGSSQRALASLDWQLDRSRHRLRALAWSGARKLELVENFTGFLERPELGDRRAQHHRSIPFGLRVDHRLAIGPKLELDNGVGLRGDVLEQREDRLVRLDGRDAPFETTRAARAVQADVWLLAGLRWQATPQLALGGGARVDGFVVAATDQLPTDVTRQGSRFAASPRADLRWTPLGSLELFAAYGRGFRPPEARAFTRFDPEREGLGVDRVEGDRARVSSSDSGELGLGWARTPKLDLRVVGFATYLARESIYDHVSRTNLQLSSTRRLGVEASVSSQPLPWLHLASSVTWVDARFVRSRNPVPLAPTLIGNLRGWLAHPRGLRAGLFLIGWAPRPLPYGARGAGFVRLDGTFGWHLDRVRVDVAIENLLGLKLHEGEYYFASDWSPAGDGSELPALHIAPGPPLNARVTLTLLW